MRMREWHERELRRFVVRVAELIPRSSKEARQIMDDTGALAAVTSQVNESLTEVETKLKEARRRLRQLSRDNDAGGLLTAMLEHVSDEILNLATLSSRQPT